MSRALAGLPYAMKVYDPDGSYPEGPGYWGYGTTFNVLGIAMLESALGTDFGLTTSRGFLKTGDFMVQTAGPSLDWYDFSDCHAGNAFSPAMFWLANRAQRPDWLWFEMPRFERDVAEARSAGSAADRLFPLALVWARPGIKAREPAAYATVLNGQNPLGFYRTSWTDPRALYLAIKAGTPSASHAHMDVGSFILEADGVRWALDLGMQGYHAMEARGLNIWDGQPGSDRWRIFRYHNRAHNTLTVDGMEQAVRGMAAFDAAATDPRQGRFQLALDSLYVGQLQAATRVFTVGRETGVTIADRVRGSEKDRQVRWTLVTPGTLKAGGDRAGWLEKDGQRLRIEVKSDAPVRLQCAPAKGPNDFDEPNPGVNLVTFDIPVPAGKEVAWSVTLTPGSVWKTGK